jgi:Family of unknown function (DUF6387)
MARRLSKAELRERYLPWFDLSKYQRCKFFGATDWFQQIACRIDLHRMDCLWGRPVSEQSSSCLAKASAYVDLLEETQAAGIVPRGILSELQTGSRDFSPERFATLTLLDTRGCAVRSMTVSDLLRAAHACDADMLYQANQQFQDDQWQIYPERSTGTLLSRTLKSSLPAATTANNLAYLVIDLNQPPSVILQQVKELIPQQFSECFYTPAAPEKARNPKYETWKDAQVLPYIDLTLWRKRLSDKSLQSQITDELISEWLELSPDSVRHTTQTNVHDLMDPYSTTFTALREQAISEAREFEDHRS